MNEDEPRLPRRTILKGLAAGIAATSILARPGLRSPKPSQIGLVGPKTGRSAFVLRGDVIRDRQSTVGDESLDHDQRTTVHPLEIVAAIASQAQNRASEVAAGTDPQGQGSYRRWLSQLRRRVNPVADQCELNGVPCVSNDAPARSLLFWPKRRNPSNSVERTHFTFSSAAPEPEKRPTKFLYAYRRTRKWAFSGRTTPTDEHCRRSCRRHSPR